MWKIAFEKVTPKEMITFKKFYREASGLKETINSCSAVHTIKKYIDKMEI